MESIAMEWGNLLLRWLHIICGIAWIGSSFYFMHLDASLRQIPEIDRGGETWEVHGGGFYQVRKYLVAPARMPAELTWHKWQSYSTWLSGFFLLMWMYYLGSELYLIDPAIKQLTPHMAAVFGIGGLALGWLVYDGMMKSPLAKHVVPLATIGFAFIIAVAYGFQQIFSGRGAMVHTGALMATIMTGNVFMNIIPNQKKVVADLIAGREPNPEYGYQAKVRSSHNNYLTLPVVFLMMSGHYPLVFSSPYAWVMIGFILVAGALIRHFYNERHAGRGDKWWAWGVSIIAMLIVIGISIWSNPGARDQLGLAPLDAPVMQAKVNLPKDAENVIISRCSMCHAAQPVWDGIAAAPKGVLLDEPGHILRQAEAIRVHAVMTHAMPPNNITEITGEERKVLAQWLAKK
jgi:uncharacterized membrane protein